MGANEKLRSSRSLESLTPPVHNYDVVVSALTGEVASHGRRAVLLLESNMFATMGYTKSYYYCLFISLAVLQKFYPARPSRGGNSPVPPRIKRRVRFHVPNPKIAPSPKNTPSLHGRENAVAQSFLPKMHPDGSLACCAIFLPECCSIPLFHGCGKTGKVMPP